MLTETGLGLVTCNVLIKDGYVSLILWEENRCNFWARKRGPKSILVPGSEGNSSSGERSGGTLITLGRPQASQPSGSSLAKTGDSVLTLEPPRKASVHCFPHVWPRSIRHSISLAERCFSLFAQ